MLYAGGTVDRLGRPDAGNTTFDFEPEEIKRKISISTAIAHLSWRDHKINLLDTPGFQDFAGDVYGALRAAEGSLLVVGASTGVIVGTELAWQQLRARNLPTLVVVNKMDKENADYWNTVDAFRGFSPRPVAIQAPIVHEGNFTGVVDLLTRKAYEFDQQGRPKEIALPKDLAAEVESRRSPLVEAAAETDDALLEKYLESGELSDAEITGAVAKGVAAGTIVPVLCAAAAKSIGIGTLLDAIVALLPSPKHAPPVEAVNPRTEQAETLTREPAGPLGAIVFKTTADPFVGRISYVKVVSGVLTTGTPLLNAAKDQPERAGTIGFPKGKLLEPATEVVAGDIAGISKLQVTATGDTLASRDHPLRLPPIEYPEQTYSAAVSAKNKADEEKVNAALVKLVDEDPIFGGSIPQNFRPSVERGVRETMEQGVLTGNPLVDIKVRLLDGSTHQVDGKDIAFKLAGAMAMRQAVMDAKPVLLEPIMDVEVLVPERNMGDVISDLNGKRGKIAGMEPSADHMEKVKAQVPLSSMYRFPIDLRSITQGRGRYTMKFSHYEEVPAHAAQTVIAAYQKSKGGEEEE